MPDGGCFEPKPVQWIENAPPSYACPVVFQIEYDAVFRAWNRYVDENLPSAMRMPLAGGWSDQPPLFIELMDILQGVRNQCLTKK